MGTGDMTIRSAVFAFLDQHSEPFTFSADGMVYIAMKYTKLDDVRRKHVMRCVRQYCEISGATVRRIRGSFGYRFTPGVKISGAIVD